MSIDPNKLKDTLLNDIKVELTEEFDLNFERKGFFSDKWKLRSFPTRRGSLLAVSNKLRGGIKSEVVSDGVRFSSAVPYATAHNEGARITVTPRMKKYFWHQYMTTKDEAWKFMALKKVGSIIDLPQRQFIGDGPETAQLIENVIKDFCKQFGLQLAEVIRKGQ
ncbi:MAG: phage virion morphogenesis protein [Prevotella sp.]|nr:phage virion morphogenesis protein [Bacteroides sp.]MCM1446450.1 phage virion morphogenesis protein [Prevotella sp.]